MLVDSTEANPLSIIQRACAPNNGLNFHRQLLGVSRQIRKEALPIYYGSNSFLADARRVNLKRWLGAIGPDGMRHLTSLKVIRNLPGHIFTVLELKLQVRGPRRSETKLVSVSSYKDWRTTTSTVATWAPVCCSQTAWQRHHEYRASNVSKPDKWLKHGRHLARKLRKHGDVEVVVEIEEVLRPLCRYE